MNIRKETEKRLKKCFDRETDLKECLEKQNLSSDCRRYLQREIEKVEENIEYYSELLDLF